MLGDWKDKDYFVITTNVDHQFQKAGFDKQRLFYTQGDYGLFQCAKPCHQKTYDNEETIREMIAVQNDMKIPTELVPHCPVCGEPMKVNLRSDDTFVEDEGWHKAAQRYLDFVNGHQHGKILYSSTFNSKLSTTPNSKPSTLNFTLWQGDITRLKVDAIVNAANSQMLGCFHPLHKCIDNAIHSAAGVQLREECYQLMLQQGHEEPTGQAKITKAYNLPCRYVIHTVGPIIPTGIPTPMQKEQLASCYRSIMQLADENHLESVAFCCISTGVFRFPNGLAAEIALKTVRDYFDEHQGCSVKQVVFNVFKDVDRQIYERILKNA